MTWNYRVFKKNSVSPSGEKSFYYEIHEVYYKKHIDDIPSFDDIDYISVDSISPQGETEEELRLDLDIMQKAFNLPTVDFDELYKNKGWEK